LTKFYYGKKIQKNGLQSRANVEKSLGIHRKDRKKRTESQATSETATFQTLPLYSDVQKKARFTLRERLHAYIKRTALQEEEED